MNWNEKCMMELSYHHMFEDDFQRQRFRDLLDCYYKAAFFRKSLCKCMYLSSWSDELFIRLLDILNEMTLEGVTNLKLMKDNVDVFLKTEGSTQDQVMKLIAVFLNGQKYDGEEFGVVDPDGMHIIRRSLQAAQYIDELPDINQG